jgi:hypothetical protein
LIRNPIQHVYEEKSYKIVWVCAVLKMNYPKWGLNAIITQGCRH